MSDPVLIHLRDAAAGTDTLVLQRLTRANAVDARLVDEIMAALDRIDAAEPAGTLVLRSAHRAFSAGFDLSEAEAQSDGDLVLRFVRIELLLQRLRRGALPSVAVVAGAAYGAGADLALACTWRLGTPEAKFRFPGFRFGLALGTRHLASVAGPQAARRILLENRLIGADEALELGLLTHLVAAGAVDETLSRLAAATRDLPAGSAARIHDLTRSASEDADLAEMIRSLAEPGLRDRIAAYLKARRP